MDTIVMNQDMYELNMEELLQIDAGGWSEFGWATLGCVTIAAAPVVGVVTGVIGSVATPVVGIAAGVGAASGMVVAGASMLDKACQ